MDLNRLISALSDPAAYPDPVVAVEVRQTHISVVFLAGSHAYKVKKPLACAFLDYGTLEGARHFCEEEVRLNRRLAPTIYLGVVPITRDPTGTGLQVEGRGEVVEWAVKMIRLPAEALLKEQLRLGNVGQAHLETLARRVAGFHARADAGPAIAAFGRFSVVFENAMENLRQSASQVGTALSPAVFEQLQALTAQTLEVLRPVIERRVVRGVPRDGHGDLRLDHVYHFPDRPPPADLIIVDCIEFDARFRCADPIADLAFLVMDLTFQGRSDLATTFASAYFRASDDEEGRALLPFYVAYRAAVRGKVEGMKRDEPEIPQDERDEALTHARAHWLLALGSLQPPERRPCLILVGGLPGAGKSTLARSLAERLGLVLIRSDEVRKELAGLQPGEAAPSAYETGIYTPELTERTYDECVRRAESRLFEGQRVVIDASFRRESSRRLFLETAARWCVPSCLLLCRASEGVVHDRLKQRRGDVSDADWSIYRKAEDQWEEPGPLTRPLTSTISTDSSPEAVLNQALGILQQLGLVRPAGASAEPPG